MPHGKETPENEDVQLPNCGHALKNDRVIAKRKTHTVASLEMPLYTMLERITTGKCHYHSLTNTNSCIEYTLAFLLLLLV